MITRVNKCKNNKKARRLWLKLLNDNHNKPFVDSYFTLLTLTGLRTCAILRKDKVVCGIQYDPIHWKPLDRLIIKSPAFFCQSGPSTPPANPDAS
jgi:hypothetical protein